MSTNVLTDESKMPWGKYKGDSMCNVPASYLVWCYESGKCSKDVKDYVLDNLDVLKEEIRRAQAKKS